MKCAMCLTLKEGKPFTAITIRGGTAVCEYHLDYTDDPQVARASRTLSVHDGKITYQKDEDFNND